MTKLTDKQKSKIVADYLNNQNFSETARINNVSDMTVKRIVEKEDQQELLRKVEQKKEENTLSVLEAMDKEKDKKINVLKKTLDFINNKVENVDDIFTSVKDVATAYGVVYDKELKYQELKIKNREIDFKIKELESQNQYEKPIVFIPAKDMAKSFVDINRDIDDRKYLEYWLKGGRGSTKSSFVSEKFIELIENNPKMCGIAMRKVGNTLKDSVFSQLQWAIGQLEETYPGISKDYKITKSPLEITKKSTGQTIYFRGADDPMKIKSIKPPKDMYIGVIWYEEFDQFDGMNAIRKIDQSVMRGGDDYVIFRTYNTPASSQHFVNKESKMPKPNRKVHLSDYRDVPVDWLGQPFFDEADYLKQVSPSIYDNEYLGVETGDGTNVFNNIELREITDEEISHFDNLYHGIDWGYYPDPFAYNDMYYDKTHRTLYIYFELEEHKKGNLDLQDIMLKAGVSKENLITADSNEMKSIGDFKMWGWMMKAAEKGPGSVEYGFKWLQSLVKIVIDPMRCPRTADEFCNYEYDKDKDGNLITGYPDGQEDHHIAATRYAMERVWKKKGQ